MKSAVDRMTLLLLLAGVLAISTAYGVLLLLPLFIKQTLHGTETDYGVITASAAITSAAAIGLLIRFPRRLPPHHVLAVASVAYALASVAVALVSSLAPLVVIGIVLGTAWAMAYTSAPMVVSELCDDRTRAKYIGYATGMIQVGFGLGPVIGNALRGAGLSFDEIFEVAGGMALFAALVVFPLHRRSPELSVRSEDSSGMPLGETLGAMVKSAALLPLIVILLCSCLFTTMNSFQTTFADSRQLNYDVFYVSYTLSVIFVRFILVRAFKDPSSTLVLAVSTIGMTIAIVMFLAVGHNAYLYGFSSVMLGMTYGLTLPAVQARAVNLSDEAYRPSMLPLVGLVFETAILVFPLVAGAIAASTNYNVLFAVLLAFAVVIAAIGLREHFRTPVEPAEADRLVPAGRS